jgi:hypothetical protein
MCIKRLRNQYRRPRPGKGCRATGEGGKMVFRHIINVARGIEARGSAYVTSRWKMRDMELKQRVFETISTCVSIKVINIKQD